MPTRPDLHRTSFVSAETAQPKTVVGISLNFCAQLGIRKLVALRYWFIPDELQQNPLTLSRAKNLLNAVLIFVIISPAYALLLHLLGDDLDASVDLLAGALVLTTPFILRVSGRITLAREILVSAAFCLFIWLSYRLGGITNLASAWILICPILAMLLGGKRPGLIWSALTMLAIAGLYALNILGLQLEDCPVTDIRIVDLYCTLGLCAVLVAFFLLFELTNTKAITELDKALRIIQELAIRDELTGAYNRRQLLKSIEEAKNRADREGTSFCLCLIDVDHFKRINDTLGHAAGDQVLKRLSTLIDAEIRKTDCFGRYGGEEFLLLLAGTDVHSSMVFVERIRQRIENTIFPEILVGQQVTVSIGIAKYQPQEGIAQTISRADMALYGAKRDGRNRVIMADS
jgi:diguanylate cyclase (GGDEF)-like protein